MPVAKGSDAAYLYEKVLAQVREMIDSGVLSAGDHVPVRCHLELGDQRFEIACQAKLVRVDPESRKLVGAFFDMPPTVRAQMVRLFGGLLPD